MSSSPENGVEGGSVCSCVKAFADGHEQSLRVEAGESDLSFIDLEDQCHRQEMRIKLLRDWWKEFEVLLMCDEVAGASALLALRKAPFL